VYLLRVVKCEVCESFISFVCSLSPLKASKREIRSNSREKIGLSFPRGLMGVISISLSSGLAQLLQAISKSVKERSWRMRGRGGWPASSFFMEEFAFDFSEGIRRPARSYLSAGLLLLRSFLLQIPFCCASLLLCDGCLLQGFIITVTY